jgi:SAM-dependent methyltransferase
MGFARRNMTAALAEPSEGLVQTLHPEQLAAMVGADPQDLPPACRAALAAADLHYDVLGPRDREAHLLMALQAGEAAGLRAAGPHRADDWERGWNENLREFTSTGGALRTLVPKYNHHRVLRLCGDYVQVADPGFEYAVYTAMRQWYFRRWFAGVGRVVELGCGTGTSLALLAEVFPQLELWGLDWAPSSQRILQQLSQTIARPIEARRFDMFAPDQLDSVRGAGVLTSAALEQIGDRHGPLLDRLLAAEPAICVHLEPLLELYDEHSLFDEVARRYHLRRNYLRGFLPRLQQLAAEGRIELLELRRTGLGSFHHEGYGVVVWRPSRRGAAR